MIASDHSRDEDLRDATGTSYMSFERNSWSDLSKTKDVTPSQPTRRSIQCILSMIENSGKPGFGTPITDDFATDAAFGSDVFDSKVMTSDRWQEFNGDVFQKTGSDCTRDSSSRTYPVTDNSVEDEHFTADFADFTKSEGEGTMPLQGENQDTHRARAASRGRQRRPSSRHRQQRCSSSGSRSVGRVLMNENKAAGIAAKQKRSRTGGSHKSFFRSKPSFVARGDGGDNDGDGDGSRRSRSHPGPRRPRSLSAERYEADFAVLSEKKPQRSHRSLSQKSRRQPGNPSTTQDRSRSRGADGRKSYSGDKLKTKNKKEDPPEPVTDSRGQDEKFRKTGVEEKSRKASGDKTPKAPASKSPKAENDHEPVTDSRGQDEKHRKTGVEDKSRKTSGDKTPKAPSSKSPKAENEKSKSLKEKSTEIKRSRSMPPKKATKTPSDKSDKATKRAKTPKGRKDKSSDKQERSPRNGTRKSSSNTSISNGRRSSCAKKSDKEPNKKSKTSSLFANPMPTKSYLSRGTQKRCKAGVSDEIVKRRGNIKTSLANLLIDESDDDGETTNAEYHLCAPDKKVKGSNHSTKSRRSRRLKHISCSQLDNNSNHSQNSKTSIRRPKSSDALVTKGKKRH